jgi:hypothetical protein
LRNIIPWTALARQQNEKNEAEPYWHAKRKRPRLRGRFLIVLHVPAYFNISDDFGLALRYIVRGCRHISKTLQLLPTHWIPAFKQIDWV